LQAAAARLTGQKPVRFVAPISPMAGLSDGDLIVVGSAALIPALFRGRC
jgi:hypothetical protein